MEHLTIEKVQNRYCVVQYSSDGSARIVEQYRRKFEALASLEKLKRGAFEGPLPNFMLGPKI